MYSSRVGKSEQKTSLCRETFCSGENSSQHEEIVREQLSTFRLEHIATPLEESSLVRNVEKKLAS